MPERRALYAGSFDPYTNGHHAIVRKAAALFDRVDVLIGVNVSKRRRFDAEAMRRAIEADLCADGIANARVLIYDGLVADYCAAQNIGWYVRGLRSAMDYAYEENSALVNHIINPELETVYLRADEPAISSSMVRELLAFGRDVRPFVPPAVGKLISHGQTEGTP